ncbi:MAG: 50S ribosomal protein L11 methyltransferase [Lentisphaerae bacterium]|nr:50S ribosomal protein L11 methyltransferase [Lentisphaerota bacterium]
MPSSAQAPEGATYAVVLESDEEIGPILEEMLDDWDMAVCLPPDGGRTLRLDVFCAAQDEAEAARQEIEAALDAAGLAGRVRLRVRAIAREDWAESWKRNFRRLRLTKRMIVRPPWDSKPVGDGVCDITIEPGLCFGTGQHATTQACLVFLDRLQRWNPRAHVLDMGCGSGILAIAAAKLGFPAVSAFDCDPDAVRIARENAAVNKVADCIQFQVADLASFEPFEKAGIVLANVLASILVEQAARVTSACAPRGRLVLSGILSRQYPDVRAAYSAAGCRELWTREREGWRTGCFERRGLP